MKSEEIELGGLPGTLTLPASCFGVVVFAHGSGSGRHSPRNRFVAEVLHRGGLATLLFDLLHPSEAADRTKVFDIPLLAERLADAVDWVASHHPRLPVGLFGASTGAAAALWVAAEVDRSVGAVVSRGGRPDLVGDRLAEVRSPTLLIVGGRDEPVLELNRSALGRLSCPARLEVVPGAGHLFEEPGALERVAELSLDWFSRHLG